MPRFENLNPEHRRPNAWDVFRWAVVDRLTRRRKVSPPGDPAPWVDPDPENLLSRDGDARITWIGHASFLISLPGATVLIDPVFSNSVGAPYPRYAPPGLTPDLLPPVDVLLITHSHYDHLDGPSVQTLPRDVRVICPVGLERWFTRRGFRKVSALDWWNEKRFGDLQITFVPARHWTQRTPFDFNRSRWGGYVLQSGGHAVYHAGDSAWFEGFDAIADRFPQLDAAMIPIGAYSPGWFMERNHMTPEQAGEAFLRVGARALIPMHYGTFQMTDEPLLEPIERLQVWWQTNRPRAAERALSVLAIGETHTIPTNPAKS